MTEFEDLLFRVCQRYEVNFGPGKDGTVECWVGFRRELRERKYFSADTPLAALEGALKINNREI